MCDDGGGDEILVHELDVEEFFTDKPVQSISEDEPLRLEDDLLLVMPAFVDALSFTVIETIVCDLDALPSGIPVEN
jgi:hypothetical protein